MFRYGAVIYVFIQWAWLNRVSHGLLDCYQCSNVQNISDCHNVAPCNTDEYCYTETTGIGMYTLFTLGCRPKQRCLIQSTTTTTTMSSLSIIGRAVDTPTDCSQCCAVDACNKQLCTTGSQALVSGQCQDDPTFDCPRVSSIFSICTDIHHAKLNCKKFCGLCNVTDGNWSSWQSWSRCSVTCGPGTQDRFRDCNNPAPHDGGLDCVGDEIQTTTCNTRACPVHGGWSRWSAWGICSVTCGIGLERRDRSCSNPYPDSDGDHCYGDSRDDRPCFVTACADGVWSDWSSWGSCSASCLGGIQSRSRACTNPAPSKFGHDCIGNSEENQACNTHYCQETNGGWSTWSSWGSCSVSTNYLRQRTRLCNNPTPSQHGQNCAGNDVQVNFCTQPSSTNTSSQWSSWSRWGSCSASCLGGIQSRTRTCARSSTSGHSCVGNSKETQACNAIYCPETNGGWSTWSSWTTCTGNMRKSTRTCTNPTPSQHGRVCIGNSETIKLCGEPFSFIRLVNGSSNLSGRVELFYNKWGTVCDDEFDDDDAKVICRMLGLETDRPYAKTNAYFGRGSLPVILDDLSCTGSEAGFQWCTHATWLTHNCNHGEDAGVVCAPRVRLVGGASHSGNVQVKYDGQWGTVCDDDFNMNAAKVVCRSLGFPSTSPQFTRSSGRTGPILLDDVVCKGTEQSLEECHHLPWGTHDCSHSEDVFVTCV